MRPSHESSGIAGIGLRAGDPLFAFDGDLRLLSWNRAAEALTGIEAEEAVGQHCWQVLGGVDRSGNLVCHPGCSHARLARDGWPPRCHELLVKSPRGRRRVAVTTVELEGAESRVFLHVLAERGPNSEHGTPETNASSPDEALIDRTTTLLNDRLTALGYDVASEISYVMERDEIEENQTITTTIAVLGFLIVALSMVGLANAITMSIIERTREIGILRCIGARARDVRRIFATEGVTLALAGWLLGLPLGYALTRLVVWLIWEIAGVRLPVVFPFWNVWIALAGTLALALLVLLLPLRRAVRYRPGDALRYA